MRHAFADAADRLRRRGFIALAGSAATAMGWPAARAQALPVIGYLGSESPERYASRLEAFREGLADAGYAEGRTSRSSTGGPTASTAGCRRWPRSWPSRPLAVIVAPGGAEVALAAKAATAKIPIVFEMGGDPVALGMVESLSRPGGNLTGVSSLSVEVSRKRLEFMREVRPAAKPLRRRRQSGKPDLGVATEEPAGRGGSLGVELHRPQGQHRAGVRRPVHRRARSAAPADSSSAPIPTSPTAASSSPRSPSATRCRRSPSRATSRSPAG